MKNRFNLIFICICVLNACQEPVKNPMAYDSHSVSRKTIEFKNKRGDRLKLTSYAPMIRIQFAKVNEDFFAIDRYEMIQNHATGSELQLEEDSAWFAVSFMRQSSFSLKISKDSLKLTYLNHKGLPILRESKSTLSNLSQFRVQFVYDQEEHFTGLGHGFFWTVRKS